MLPTTAWRFGAAGDLGMGCENEGYMKLHEEQVEAF